MYIIKKSILFLLVFTVLTGAACAQKIIAAKDAAKHIGDSVTITAKVFGGKVFDTNMILLDVGGYNPNQELTLMIPATAKEKFKGRPDVDYKGKDVTITGVIINFKGKPEIVLNGPKQIKLVMFDTPTKMKSSFN